MSDLGAIFHVKKAGVQYDAHAYTTLDECPEPNLKLKYKGQQGYVKLENKGEGDVPCYVKTKAGKVFQVRKEAVPTGSLSINGNITFTVPAGVKVIFVASPYENNYEGLMANYVRVTPNTVHHLKWKAIYGENVDSYTLQCSSHSNKTWTGNHDYGRKAFILWSSEINKKTPTVIDD